MSRTIAIVEDEAAIRENYADVLRKQGYEVHAFANRPQAMEAFNTRLPDLAIIDIGLEDEIDGGFSLCQSLRAMSNTLPIIFLTARDNDFDTVCGLRMGADDYLTKPFSSRELLARVKSLLRRSHGALAEQRRSIHQSKLPAIQFLDWTLDLMKHSLIDGEGVTVPLSHGEYELLLAFVERPQRVLSRELLLDITSDRDATPFDRSIDVQVGRLRKKLEADPKDPQIIITVRGGGYQFVPEVRQES